MTDTDLDVGVEEDWFVIPGVMHGAGGWLFSGKDWVPWFAFTRFADQPPGNAAAGPRAAPRRVPRDRLPDWTLVWLTRPAAAPRAGSAAAHVAEPEEERQEEAVERLTEEEAAQVDLELAQWRAWLAFQFPGDLGDFHIRIVGGRWTAERSFISCSKQELPPLPRSMVQCICLGRSLGALSEQSNPMARWQ